MKVWSDMSKGLKWLVGVATTVITLGGAFTVLGGGAEVIDQMVESEAEHDHDIQAILRAMRMDDIEGKMSDQVDLKNRNEREWDRLDRDLKGGNYSNDNEKDSMLRSLERNEDGIKAADTELLKLGEKLEEIEDA